MARPTKNIEEKKIIQVNIRYNILDYDKIHELSKLSGLTMTEFIRKSSLNKRIPKAIIHPVNRELLVLLSRYYNSLVEFLESDEPLINQHVVLISEIQAVFRLLQEIKLHLVRNDCKAS